MKCPGLFFAAVCSVSSSGLAGTDEDSIDEYIEKSWRVLERTPQDISIAAVDPKLGEMDRYPVYVAPTENLESVANQLHSVLGDDGMEQIELKVLPDDVVDNPEIGGGIENQGLLYLPHSYVVPGGRFNEMYGWDSYFINLGLLASGRVQQAQFMVDNHLYQVEHYGRVLNANRTYYLTRSQPPFLASMVADVYRVTGDREWLARAVPALLTTYRFWTSAPHLTPETGLSRYYDLGEGEAPEVVADEVDDEGKTHYERIKIRFREYAKLSEAEQLEELGYPLDLYYEVASDRLTPLFYKGDRSMRESGYDPSDRFGRFNIDTVFYNPVDLNSLLYLYEKEMARLSAELGGECGEFDWEGLAEERKERMSTYLWDEEAGLFFDYNVRTKTRRVYPFATTYFPLWTGWASPAQASRVHQASSLFLKPGGVVTSTHRSGNQWDYPFGWAPLQLVAVLGLAEYGYHQTALQASKAFLSLVSQEYDKTRTIVEKYDVVERSSQVSSGIEYGYSSNEIGFGWTNAVYLVLNRYVTASSP